MRVIHCIPNLGGGGAERQLTLLAEAQVRHGDDVDVVVGGSGSNHARLARSGAQIHEVAARGNHDLRISAAVRRLARARRADVVQTWLPQMDVFGGMAAGLARIPWILSERASELAYRGSLKHRLLRPLIARSVSAVVANSRAGLQYWDRQLPAAALRALAPNIIPVDELRAAAPAHLASLGLPAATPLVLFAGRLTPQKNLPAFLSALQIVAARSDAVAAVLGEGPLRVSLERLAAALGLGGRVVFAGYRSDLAGLLKVARVFVNPSVYEGQPNTVLEAMACGCPVVVSDISEHREVLSSETALLADPMRPTAIADAILRVLADPEAARARAAHAGRAAERFTPNAAVAAYEEVYRQVARGARAPKRVAWSTP